MNQYQSFKQAIRNHISDIKLEDHQLSNLNRIQENRQANIGTRRLVNWAMAASALIAVLVISVLNTSTNSILSQIAGEVAENHLRLDKIEYQSNRFEMISRHFDKLGFTPQLPRNSLDLNELSLLGARYCSISGSIALQLRYGENIIDSATLYIASPKEEIKKKVKEKLTQPDIRYVTRINDVVVQLWYEQDLFYAISQ